jgi:hypothetical protein
MVELVESGVYVAVSVSVATASELPGTVITALPLVSVAAAEV